MKIIDRLSVALNPPPIIEVRRAADHLRIPEGFLRIQVGEQPEGLGFRHATFGMFWQVQPTFEHGGLRFALNEDPQLLPLVHIIPFQSAPRCLEDTSEELVVTRV